MEKWLFFYFPVSLVLIKIVFEDIKNRAISIWVFPLLLACAIIGKYLYFPTQNILYAVLLNVLFVVFLTSILYLYCYARFGKKLSFFNDCIGFGDILFLLVISPLFAPFEYLLFIVISSITILVVHWVVVSLKMLKHKNVPLAGYWSLCLLGTIYFNHYNILDLSSF